MNPDPAQRRPSNWGLPKVDPMLPFHAPARNTFHGGRRKGTTDQFVERMRLLETQRKPEQTYTQAEIAAFCGSSRQYVEILEKRALRKMRMALPADVRDALFA